MTEEVAKEPTNVIRGGEDMGPLAKEIGSHRPESTTNSQGDPSGRRSTPLLIRQWKYLWREESVELRIGLDVIGTGLVDDVTADGTTLWVHLGGGLGRMMIHHTDGTDIWRIESRISQDRCAPEPVCR